MNDSADTIRRLSAPDLAAEIEGLVETARQEALEDPFGNPILRVSLALTRRMDRGELSEADIGDLLQAIGRAALTDRARRLRGYVGLDGGRADPFAALAERLAEDAGDFDRFREAVERPPLRGCFHRTPDLWNEPWAGPPASRSSPPIRTAGARRSAAP